MKTLKRLLLRPIYAIYWIYITVRGLFGTSKIRYYRFDFNTWLERYGFYKLSTRLHNIKMIVPREYSELIKKYPNTKYIDLREVEKPNDDEAKNFYHWVD